MPGAAPDTTVYAAFTALRSTPIMAEYAFAGCRDQRGQRKISNAFTADVRDVVRATMPRVDQSQRMLRPHWMTVNLNVFSVGTIRIGTGTVVLKGAMKLTR
jgi:hypothetical protein